MQPDLRRLLNLVRAELGFQIGVPSLRSEEREVWRLARMHKVATILAPGILESEPSVFLVDEARYLWQLAALRETYYVRRCEELMGRLAAEGISSFPLKGVELARHAYPKKGMRSFRDLDLLVAPKDVARADEILKGGGFQPKRTAGPLPRAVHNRGNVLLAAQGGLDEVSYERDDLFLELHTVLLPVGLGSYPLDHVWSANALPPEDFFVHLLFHSTRHHFLYGLRHLVDLAIWAGERKPSYDLVNDRLGSSGLLPLAWPAWKLASESFPETVPEPPAYKGRILLGYTDRVKARFDRMPLEAIKLAGSPLPFLLARKKFVRSVLGNRAKNIYQSGEGTGFVQRSLWRVTRPFALFWRHAPVLRRWASFARRRACVGVLCAGERTSSKRRREPRIGRSRRSR